MLLFYVKDDLITLDEVQLTVRTKVLTKVKKFMVDDNGEDLNFSRGKMRLEETIRGKNLGLSKIQRVFINQIIMDFSNKGCNESSVEIMVASDDKLGN